MSLLGGRTGNSAAHSFTKQPHNAGQWPHRRVFIPPSVFEVAAPRSERKGENTPFGKSLRIGRFISVYPFVGREEEKMDWSRERREPARRRDQCPSAAQKQENIKCFSLLLGSYRCAGLVTLATGSGAEHLIGLRVCKCVSRTGEVKVFKWKINPLFTYR